MLFLGRVSCLQVMRRTPKYPQSKHEAGFRVWGFRGLGVIFCFFGASARAVTLGSPVTPLQMRVPLHRTYLLALQLIYQK